MPWQGNSQSYGFMVFCILMPVLHVSAAVIPHQRYQIQTDASRQSLLKTQCLPEFTIASPGDCAACSDGIRLTHYLRGLTCSLCSVCKAEEDEIHPCNLTDDRKCQCKAGTFLERNAPEHCQKCSTGCPSGMVQGSPCTPWSDLICVPIKRDTNTTGETTVSGELGTPTSASPPTGPGHTGMEVGLFIALAFVSTLLVVYVCWKHFDRGCRLFSSIQNRVSLWICSPSLRSGVSDNAHNEALSKLKTPLNPELQREDQEQVQVRGTMDQIPVEAQPLQGSPEAEGSQVKRILLPANDADPTETLQSFFDDIIKIVPFHSWNKVMRHMGLTDFEITIATESATSLEDKPYNMLKKWLQKRGRKASVNTLLDALEAREERNAKEKIQDLLVGSGKYTYAENRADRL